MACELYEVTQISLSSRIFLKQCCILSITSQQGLHFFIKKELLKKYP